MTDIAKSLEHAALLRFVEPRFTAGLPELAPEARRGLAGQFLELFEPHTEADPAAMLVQFLAAFGNAVGRGPYFGLSGACHRMNLFVMVVGRTSTGRKGTSLAPVIGEVWGLVEKATPEWQIANGLSSGEGLIHAVRDRLGDDPGVEDKRLMVVEPEFAAVLARIRREGNTLSAVVREAWDGKQLRTMTKTSPMCSTGAHLTIIGNITPKELRACLQGSLEVANGFGNRFLWVFSERRKSLPVATSPDTSRLAGLTASIASVIDWASQQGALHWSRDAAEAWSCVYDRLTEGPGGALEEVAARGTAQVVRLASLFALLDRQTEVGAEHLTAALAVWRYTMESAARIFEVDGTGDRVADRVLEALRQTPSGLGTTEIHRKLSNNVPGPRLSEALDLLHKRGHVAVTKTGKRGSHYRAAEFVDSSSSSEEESA